MLAGVRRRPHSGQHPRQLRHTLSAVDTGGSPRDRAFGGLVLVILRRLHCLLHDNLGVGEGGHLGQVGDHQDLVAPGQLGQGPADGQGRLPADAGVDLVEHQRLGRLLGRQGEHQAQGQHGAGQLATRPRPAPGAAWVPPGWRRGGRRRTVVARLVAPTVTSMRALGMAS